MKVAIIGDLHFGVRGNSIKHLEFQSKWFNDTIKFIKNAKINYVVFLGDIFDSRNSISPIINSNVRLLFQKLAKNVKEVHCVLGNHDIYFRNKKDIHSLEVLADQGVKVYTTPQEVKIGNLKCLMVPWVIKTEQEDVSKLLVNNYYDICFGHLEINTFEKVKNVREQEGFERELFSNCKKVISGHFHLKRQIDNILYVGTPYELTWNDYQDEKGIHVVDDNLEVTFHASENTPKHIVISNKIFSLDELTKDKIHNNIIKVSFEQNLSEVDKINYIEKINSFEPLMFTVVEDDNTFLDTNGEMEADIKDTLGFLFEYLNIIDIPDNLNKKKLMEKIEEVHKKII